MDFLRRLGSVFSPKPNDPGIYYFVRCNKCGEVLRVRINPYSEISQTDEGNFYVRKVLVGKQCRSQLEAEFYFTGGNTRKLKDIQISGGERVERKVYDDYMKDHPAPDST